MKQYVPKKPIRRGFKVWVVADSENGYFLDMDVYVGRPSDGVRIEHGLGARVILRNFATRVTRFSVTTTFLLLNSSTNYWSMASMHVVQ